MRLVVASGDHERARRVGLALDFDGAFGHPHHKTMLKHLGKHRRACVGRVGHQIGIGRSLPAKDGVKGRSGRAPFLQLDHWGGQRVGLQSVDIGQGPGCDVIGQTVAQGGVGVHQDLQQARHGLPCIEHQVSLIDLDLLHGQIAVIQSAVRRGTRGPVAADAIGVHEVGQPLHLRRIVGAGHHIRTVIAPRFFCISSVVGREFLEHARGMVGGGFDGGEPAFHVVLDAVAQSQGVPEGRLNGPSRTSAASLLVGHAHRPTEHGPSVPVAGVKQVKHFPREVQGPTLVEVLGIVLSDVPLALPLPGRNDGVVRFSSRGKIVGAVDALFVEIHMHLGHPFLVECRPRLRLALGLPGQIAVHVEQEVIGAASWPRFVVFPSTRVDVASCRGGLVLKMNIAVPAIGVDAGIDENHSLLQQCAVGGGQGLCGGHGGLGANGFVAVHVVTQVDPDHTVAGVHTFFHALSVLGFQGFQIGHVLWRRHDQAQQGTAFTGGAIFRQLPMGPRRRKGFHGVHHLVVAGEFFSQLVSQDGAEVHRRRLGVHALEANKT